MPEQYQDWRTEDTFVVSGHLRGSWPIDDKGNEIRPRVLSKLEFESTEEAMKYLTEKYGRVYEDLSNEDLGIWRGRVPRPKAKASPGVAA